MRFFLVISESFPGAGGHYQKVKNSFWGDPLRLFEPRHPCKSKTSGHRNKTYEFVYFLVFSFCVYYYDPSYTKSKKCPWFDHHLRQRVLDGHVRALRRLSKSDLMRVKERFPINEGRILRLLHLYQCRTAKKGSNLCLL